MARLTQIIDRSQIISLQKRLTSALGMSVVFEEPNAGLLNVIGQRGGVCKACTDFIDRKETGKRMCLVSDSRAAWDAQRRLGHRSPDEIVVQFYVCNGQLRNFVIPICIGGEVIGNLFSGQFLVETLKTGDPEFSKMLLEMQELGVRQDEALTYAKLPVEEEIPQIARANNISPEDSDAFEIAYKEILKNAMPLRYVIDTVYLLNEIAQTLSALGNAYYYNDICTKLTGIVHDQLGPVLADKLEEVSGLVQMIRAKPNIDLSSEMAEANQLIHEILSIRETRESAYIRELLLPYNRVFTPVPREILELQKRLLVARSMYDSRKTRTVLNKHLRLKTINPHSYNGEQSRLLDDFNSQLQAVEKALDEEPTAVLEHFDDEDGVIRQELIAEIGEWVTNLQPRQVDREIGLDDIENLLAVLIDADFGLQRIRNGLCDERVLKELPPALAEVRQKLRLGYDIVYLNWGGISSSSNSVVREVDLCAFDIDRHGPVSAFSERLLESPSISENLLSSARGTVANLLKCEIDEVVLTHNTTHGIEMALSSVDFPPKGGKSLDRVLITNCEHDAVLHCVKQIERKFNVAHDTLDLLGSPSATEVVDEIISKCSDGGIKVVIISHVTFNTGLVLSIADIIQGVRDRVTGKAPLFLVDGAQAVGHIPVDVSALNCDFYAADAHKWLMGPRGSGFLCVKKSYLEERRAYFSFYENYMVAEKFRPRKEESDTIYEPATMSTETYVGMKSAIELVLDTHRRFPQMYERIVSLSEVFKQLVLDRLRPYGGQVINSESGSGLVGVMFSGQDDFRLYDEIRKSLDARFHILVRALGNPSCLRFSISYLNSEWEINFAVAAMESVLQEIPSLAKLKASADREQEILRLKKGRVSQSIESMFDEAKSTLNTRYKESLRKSNGFGKVTVSKQVYAEDAANLEEKEQELLRQAETSKSAQELEGLESVAMREIDKIIYGKHP